MLPALDLATVESSSSTATTASAFQTPRKWNLFGAEASTSCFIQLYLTCTKRPKDSLPLAVANKIEKQGFGSGSDSRSTSAGSNGSHAGSTDGRLSEDGTPSRRHSAHDVLAESIRAPFPVEAWGSQRFEKVRLLMEAPRNQGRVFHMRDRLTKCSKGCFAQVAVKQMPNSWVLPDSTSFKKAHPNSTEDPWLDLGILRYLNSIAFPHVCELVGIFRDAESTYIATGLATGGDLFAWVENLPGPGQQREGLVLPVIADVFNAVRWLHDLGIVHRDLSLENIVMAGEDGSGHSQVRLIDFGASSLDRYSTQEKRGKRSYIAPEMHTSMQCDGYLTDAFAVGVVAYSIVVGSYPWNSTVPEECRAFAYFGANDFDAFTRRRKVQGVSKCVAEVISAPILDMLEGVLRADQQKRAMLGESAWLKTDDCRMSVWEYEAFANITNVRR